MLDVEIIKNMEKMAKKILQFPEESREEAFAILAENGMPDDALQHFREYVFYYHMFTDSRFYKAVEQSVGKMYLETVTK